MICRCDIRWACDSYFGDFIEDEKAENPVESATQEMLKDKIEQVLKGKQLWVFPGPMTSLSWRLRRWFPESLWWSVHRIEKI